MRASGSEVQSTRLSGMMNSRGSFIQKQQKKADPYNLDFTELCKNYVDETTIKIPFVKSSFVHYSKCPRAMEINGKEYKDLVITMEVVQAPNNLNYTQLSDPKAVREQEIKAKKEAAIREKKDKILAERKAAKAAKHAERDAAKEEKNRAKQMRAAEKLAAKEER